METKFTPGPWFWDAIGVFGPEGEHIASVTPHNRIANAALIAAAPELYEALEKLKVHIESGEEFNSRNYGPSTGINGDECLNLIDTALKKARGEK